MREQAARLRVWLLGGFRVELDGQPVDERAWRQRRVAQIVQYLALAPGYRAHREQLMELLWPDYDLDAQSNTLRQMVHRARQAFASAAGETAWLLRRDGTALVLAAEDDVWVDVDAFERALGHGWRESDIASLRAAIDLYGGDLLPDDPYTEWVETRRTALRAAWLAALDRLATLLEAHGDPEEALETWRRLVVAEPAHEPAHVALMRLHARLGRRSYAIAQYERLCRALADDLAGEPEPATSALAEAIRSGAFPAPDDAITAEAPPPRAAPPAPAAAALPEPLSALIGREREIAEVCQLLTVSRLVTLTGPGGIGKTRLALAVAHELASAFPDGVHFVDLATVRDPALVIPAIAQTLGVNEQEGRRIEDVLLAALERRQQLLVIDNFEQVIDAAPRLSALFERARQLRALVTSRMRLRLRGEREYGVPPLGLAGQDDTSSTAVELFVRRAQEVHADFVPAADTLPVVADICRRLDGLPLAIELAAARVGILPVERIRAALSAEAGSGALRLLASGPRDLPERQRTIRATIGWSYDLLSPASQAVLRRLCAFAGGWTLEAAEAVAGGPAIDMLDELATLTDAHLIVRHSGAGPEPRFTMLETIHEFAHEQLVEAGEEDATRDRQLDWAIALAAACGQLDRDSQIATLEGIARVTPEFANLRVAFDRACERRDEELATRLLSVLNSIWFFAGRQNAQTRATLELLLAHPFLRERTVVRARACHYLGMYTGSSGDIPAARAAFEEGLATAHDIGDLTGIARNSYGLGLLETEFGDLDLAPARFQVCVSIASDLGDVLWETTARMGLAAAYSYRGDLAAAIAAYEETLARYGSIDFVPGVTLATLGLARCLAITGDTARSRRLLLDTLAGFRHGGPQTMLAVAIESAAMFAAAAADWERSATLAGAAQRLREETAFPGAERMQLMLDRVMAPGPAALPGDAWQAAWQRGRALPLAEAIALAERI